MHVHRLRRCSASCWGRRSIGLRRSPGISWTLSSRWRRPGARSLCWEVHLRTLAPSSRSSHQGAWQRRLGGRTLSATWHRERIWVDAALLADCWCGRCVSVTCATQAISISVSPACALLALLPDRGGDAAPLHHLKVQKNVKFPEYIIPTRPAFLCRVRGHIDPRTSQ